MTIFKKSLVAIFAALLFFASCIEYEEKLTIKKNGSGTISMTYGMPLEMVEKDASFTADKIRDDLSEIEGVTVVSTKDFVKDELKWVKATARFKSLENLGNIKNDQLPGFSGAMAYTDNKNGSFTFTKTLGDKPKNPKPDNEKDVMMMKNMIGDVAWNYEITFPMHITDTQAGSGEINLSGKTVSWSVPLVSFIGGQTTLTVQLGKRGKAKPVIPMQTVVLNTGEKVQGEVLSLTKTTCVVRVGGKRERIRREDIKTIEF